jgi:hypothetical protein
MFTPASASFRPNLAELKVDAALGAHIAKMCELAWLVLEFDTEEVHHNSPPRGSPTLRNLRPWPVRRKAAAPDGADRDDDLVVDLLSDEQRASDVGSGQ